MNKRGYTKVTDNRMELYKAGLSDDEIGKRIWRSPVTICVWRKKMNLPANKHHRETGVPYQKALPKRDWGKGAAFIYTMTLMRKYCKKHDVAKVDIDMEHVRRAFDSIRTKAGV